MRSGEGSVQDGRGMGRGVFKMKGDGGGECSKWKGGGGSGGGGSPPVEEKRIMSSFYGP